jgi:hypothetical protein
MCILIVRYQHPLVELDKSPAQDEMKRSISLLLSSEITQYYVWTLAGLYSANTDLNMNYTLRRFVSLISRHRGISNVRAKPGRHHNPIYVQNAIANKITCLSTSRLIAYNVFRDRASSCSECPARSTIEGLSLDSTASYPAIPQSIYLKSQSRPTSTVELPTSDVCKF